MGYVQDPSGKKSPLRKPVMSPGIPSTSLNSRSCINCHKRKVRCDRRLPCAQCDRVGWACSYPSADRHLSRKAAPVQDITTRLERIETILLRLCDGNSLQDLVNIKQKNTEVTLKSPVHPLSPNSSDRKPWEVLLKNGNRVHYVDNENLLNLFQDDDRINAVEPQPLHEETPSDPSRSDSTNLNIGFPSLILGPSPTPSSNLAPLYPDLRLALKLWTIYVENVDPVVKVLHIPTTQSAMVTMMSEPDQADPSLSALAFAVYFAAVTSLDEGQVSALSPDNRQALLYRFKTGLNQAITDANLLNQPDVMVLQAVAIFATCLRVHDISRSVWILIGTAIRLAQSIGIHRDGASLKLSPFETELRLRLWWQLCSLDARAPEDHGFAVTIENFDQGLRFPRDINDDQLFPAMKALPPDATTWTEATYFLVQIEAFKVLNEVLGPKSTKHADAKLDLIAKRQALETHNAWMNSRYFALEPSSSIQNAAYTHYKTVCAKIEFMILVREELHLHSSHETASIKAPPRGLGRTPFLAAYRNLVSSYSLIGGEASNNFKWLFQTYAQWYALAYSLRYLGAFPTAPEADQAWDIINRTFDKIPYSQKLPSSMSQTGPGRSSIWGCLELLRFQASAARMNVLSSSNTEISAGKTQNKRPEFDNIDYHGNVEQGNPSSSSSIASHQTLTQPISLSHVPAMEFSHMHDMIDQSSDREEGWQNGLFPFSRSALSEMLYLPGWCDVVNIGSDMTE